LIIKINDESLVGVSNKEASTIIESTFMNDMISISYVRCPDVADEDCFFRPTWNYFISIPSVYQTAKSVQVFKDLNDFLGLTIVGGKDTNFERVFIKSIIPNSSVARSKSLRFDPNQF
jgi:ligand of Numb protein X 1/2